MTVMILMPIATVRGGAEVLLQTLLQHGRDAGIRWVVVFLEDGPMVETHAALGVTTHVVPAGRLRQGWRWWAAVQTITDLARLEGADLLLSWMAKAHLYGAFAARCAGVPAVWYQHGIPDVREPLDRLATLLPAQAVFACSETAAAAQRCLWPRRRTRVAYPCVDLARYDPDGLPTPTLARRQLGLPETGPLIGSVGRLQRWKGMHVLVEAMPAILRRHPDTHCVIVGGRHEAEASYERELHEQIQALGLTERVILAGFQTDIPLWMQAMDVFVHAADREPFGMVVVEAMALGKPVVAGAAGGPAEVISESMDGLLAPYADAAMVAEQILKYLDAPESARRVGTQARLRARGFSAPVYANHLVALLDGVSCGPDGEGQGLEASVTIRSLRVPVHLEG